MTRSKRNELLVKLFCYGMAIAFYVIYKTKMAGLTKARDINSLTTALVPICAYVTMAISLNLVVGISGELSLGHAGFMSIGAFVGAIVSEYLLKAYQFENEIMRLSIAMVVGGILAGVFGFLIGIPVLKLRGDYLAIVTLAFGEIIRNVLNCVYVNVDGKAILFGFNDLELSGKKLFFGATGTNVTAKIATLDAGFVLVMVALVVVLNLMYSRTGRAIMACRDSRIAAESVGINPTRYKMTAFVTSAFLAGMAGALLALSQKTVAPSKFDYNASILILVYVVLGGIGNIWGCMISSVILYELPIKLSALTVNLFGMEIKLSTSYMLIYAILLIAAMLINNSAWKQRLGTAMKKKLTLLFRSIKQSLGNKDSAAEKEAGK